MLPLLKKQIILLYHSICFTGILLLLFFGVTSTVSANPKVAKTGIPQLPTNQIQNTWFQSGEKQLSELLNQPKTKSKAKNVLLFIGDGMGISTLTASRILEGQLKGELGDENHLSFETFPYSALIKTYNTNQQTPDSAGTMTAIMTGVKTKAGVISIGPEAKRGACESTDQKLITALEIAEAVGKSTGIVTTARVTHATPAATYSHTTERDWEDDSYLHTVSHHGQHDCGDIAKQLIEFPYGDGIDVVFGGGRRHFLPKEKGGRRAKGDLIQRWLNRSDHRRYVTQRKEISQLKPSYQVMGLFSDSHLPYHTDRNPQQDPSLSELTDKAIQLLAVNSTGFFLMVESGRIDHAHHAGNAYRALTDTIEFSKAIQLAVQHPQINLNETLIIVTADHSHVLTLSGYSKRGSPILGKVQSELSRNTQSAHSFLDQQGLPYTILNYQNGLGFAVLKKGGDDRYQYPVQTGRVDITEINTQLPGYHQEALVPLKAETHGGEDVVLYAIGAGSEWFRGTLEQHVIFHLITKASDLILPKSQ